MFRSLSLHRLAPLLLLLFTLGAAFTASCDDASRAGDGKNKSHLQTASVVAVVNQREIPLRLYEMYLKNARAELGLDETIADGRDRLAQLREGIVSELIDRELIAQEAARRGLAIPRERFADAERRAITQLGGEEKYAQYLTEHGLKREEYGEIIRKQIYGEMLREALSRNLNVTDDEVKIFYEENRNSANYHRPERVTAAHILIAARPAQLSRELGGEGKLSGAALESAVRAELERRRALAESVRRKALAASADFGALAREFSDDAGSRARGGELGSFTRDSHPRPFDDVAFTLKPGGIGPVVRTDFGFHIIKVLAREPARQLTLEESAPEIRRLLAARKEGHALREWLTQARRRAAIRISAPFRFGALKDEFPAS